MKYLTSVLSLLALSSCIVDVGLIVKKSRLFGELGWGIPSPFSFILVTLACLLFSLTTPDKERRPAGMAMKVSLVLGAMLLFVDQVVVMFDLLAPVIWTAFGSPFAMLLLGIGILSGGVGLLRGGMRTTASGMLTLARVALLAGGGGVVILNVLQAFRVTLSYVVGMYVLPGSVSIMCVGIAALALSMKKGSAAA